MLCENLKGVILACLMKSHSISTSERKKVVKEEGGLQKATDRREKNERKKKKSKEQSYIYGRRPRLKRRAKDIGNCASRGLTRVRLWKLCLTRVRALEVVPHTCECIGSCASHV